MRSFLKLNGILFVVWAALICIPIAAFGQGYGSITGTVTDPTGALVPGAAVTATQAGTGLELRAVSSNSGSYCFPSLAPSVYNISAGRSGFEAYNEKGVQVRADAAVTVNITLKP